MIIKARAVLAALMIASGPAFAGDATVGDIAVQGAWARASAGPARNGAAFMTIVNGGKQADQLVGAAADVSAKVELHTHVQDGDVMRMRQVATVDLAADRTVTMQPGGVHVMLLDLKAPLKEGASFPLTLKFAKAGEVTVTVDVGSAGAMGGPAREGQAPHGHMPHGAKH